jgi:hypothetical protein
MIAFAISDNENRSDVCVVNLPPGREPARFAIGVLDRVKDMCPVLQPKENVLRRMRHELGRQLVGSVGGLSVNTGDQYMMFRYNLECDSAQQMLEDMKYIFAMDHFIRLSLDPSDPVIRLLPDYFDDVSSAI